MPNVIKYSLSAQTEALKKGNFWIGTGDVGKGPTSSSDYWQGITPPTGGYTIYLNKASQGPSIYAPTNDDSLITLTNMIGSQSFTSVTQCFNWYNTQSDKMVFNRDYPEIITSGLVLNLDAGFIPSYSTSGVTWYDISSGGNNGTLINGPTFNSGNGGSIVLDGANDYVALPTINTNSNFTLEFWTMRTSNTNPTLFGGTPASGYLQIRNAVQHVSMVKSFTAELGNFGVSTATPLNVVKNIVITYSAPSSYICYIDGVQIGTLNTTQTYTTTAPAIGINTNFTEPYSGRHYKFAYYNRVLTATEVLQNYNAQKSRFGL